ncbi:Histone acetyltransferase [Actinidia chinensis var. chinensis]|uniref:Histone acetyltransferase n=1 Tax=Actinidia chinensis var. chinensis TaxID=1590841 RepID=A0A2R6P2M2_ACTCC|nr:Histone acetyltransferase [Actinidia chinensis var. chinensis]
MPRPGPRPYECVRRSWHSDRHQPIRGTIIQQIIRVVNESHSSATKKNREWQEKLPIVVLKAEEIIYSKANSEAEYMDRDTLWDRVNDAVNTIIRRDESTETGDLLPPCVEAALNLGCVLVRASRSERHANPRSYLSPRTQETSPLLPNIADSISNERNPQLVPLHSGNQLTFAGPLVTNSTYLVTKTNRHVMQNNRLDNPTTSCNFPSPRVEVPLITSKHVGKVYPLYYGTSFRPEMPRFGFQVPANSNSIIVGTPIFPSILEPAKPVCLQNLVSCESDGNSSKRIGQADFRNNHEKAPETGFDLSLRLGLFKDLCDSSEKPLAQVNDNVDLSSSQKRNNFSNLSPHQNKEYSFFPMKPSNDRFGFHTRPQNFWGESENVDAAVRKRKAPASNNLGDQPFFS